MSRWTPLVPAGIRPLTDKDIPDEDVQWAMAKLQCDDPAKVRAQIIHEMESCEYWINDIYQVAKRPLPKGHEWNQTDVEMVHLNIRRRDGRPIFRDWRHFQAIKNQLVGEECEAVEIYPAESRLSDTSNKYHLFCFPPGMRVPLGMHFGRDVRDDTGDRNPGRRQRKL